jgi:hypothetical protein
MSRAILAAVLLGWVALTAPGAEAQPVAGPAGSGDCGSTAGLAFVCGAENPEDLARIPGTRWLIASGFSPGAGLKLVDTAARDLRRWYTGAPDQVRPDRKAYPACPGPVDPRLFNARGVSLRAQGDGRFTLHVINHGGRQSVEVFAVDARPPAPTLTWLGCLPMPGGQVGNAVATYSDGTVLATVLTRPGTTITDFVQGKVTGAVYQWAPGDTAFRLLPGTELPGNNGLETSRDDRQFYVVAFGLHSVLVYSRADTSRPLRQALAPDFMPDNIHWDGDRLIAAGMRYDEPACGGPRGLINGVADPMTCHRGYVVAQFDPATGGFRTLAYGEPDPVFNAVSAAVVIDGELWLGAFRADRLAHRPLPGAPHGP